MVAEKQQDVQKHSGKKLGRGAHECQMCGRKQGLVSRYNLMLCRQCFREWAPKMGFKKMD